jgi:two-component system sensor histidine kinase BaeS
MKLNITAKLLLAILGTSAVIVVAMTLLVNWSFRQGFQDYLRQQELQRLDGLATALQQQYQQQGDWEFLRHNTRLWHQLLSDVFESEDNRASGIQPVRGDRLLPPPPRHEESERSGTGLYSRNEADRRPPPGPEHRPPPGRRPPPGPGHRPPPPPENPTGRRIRLIDLQGEPVIGRPEASGDEIFRPVSVNGEIVGRLAIVSDDLAMDEVAMAFSEQQRRSYLVIAAGAFALSLLVSILLARQLIRPIRRLAAGANKLACGDYDTRINVTSQDELGELALDFNKLSETLKKNEKLRQQWITDISHELRTPLAVLRGEIEAMQDGIRLPDMERLHSLHGEVLSLAKLVDDLYGLSLSDMGAQSYRMAPLEPGAVIEDVVNAFETRFGEKNISLTIIRSVKGPLTINGDGEALHQLFSNLAENAYRYTDTGGQCEIHIDAKGGRAIIEVRDSAPAVPADALPRLFERLYRVDTSRSRALGGSGLGLSICKNLVEAHGGEISVHQSPLGGLTVRVALPLYPAEA